MIKGCNFATRFKKSDSSSNLLALTTKKKLRKITEKFG